MCLYVWGPEDSLRRHASGTNDLFLKQDLFLAWDLQLVIEPQGFVCLVSIALGLPVRDRTLGSFTLGFWGSNSGSRACKVSTVQMESSPPSHRCLWVHCTVGLSPGWVSVNDLEVDRRNLGPLSCSPVVCLVGPTLHASLSPWIVAP